MVKMHVLALVVGLGAVPDVALSASPVVHSSSPEQPESGKTSAVQAILVKLKTLIAELDSVNAELGAIMTRLAEHEASQPQLPSRRSGQSEDERAAELASHAAAMNMWASALASLDAEIAKAQEKVARTEAKLTLVQSTISAARKSDRRRARKLDKKARRAAKRAHKRMRQVRVQRGKVAVTPSAKPADD